MNNDAYRDLQLLTEISSGEAITQRGLAKRFGLALGLTNFLIHRLIKKGYVKIVNLNLKRSQYLITTQGAAEQIRLTYEYLEYSCYFYRHIRTFLSRALPTIADSGGTNIVVYGAGEVAEIVFLILQQHRVNVVAVVDDRPDAASTFMQYPIRPASELADYAFDWVVVASLKESPIAIERLLGLGIPRARILAPEVRAGNTHAMFDAPMAMMDVTR